MTSLECLRCAVSSTGDGHESQKTQGEIMYDNSATLALTGSGITILGQGAGFLVLTIAGVLFLVLGGVLSLAERRHRRDTTS